jgi:two-component system, NtrC family, sensor histidine kinase HydH
MNRFSKSWISIPPWIFIGAAVLLMPIFAFMATSHISRQKTISTRLLVEKGAALIRSFEAGTRTGMMGMPRGQFRLQRLLTETAQLPDIVYLYVTDTRGRALAHSNTDRIGTVVRTDLDLSNLGDAKQIHWRRIVQKNNLEVFEVYRRFEPTAHMGHPRRHAMDHLRGHRFPQDIEMQMEVGQSPLVIFVGLSMEAVESARRADTRHTILMALTLLLIGCAGIILLFLGQRYRKARSSLSRVQAISDTVVDTMPIGLVVMNGSDTVVTINPTAAGLLDTEPAQCIGKSAADILPPQLLDLTRQIQETSNRVDTEIDCRLSEDRRVPLQISGCRLNDNSGQPLGYFLVFKDLSEIEELRKQIARHQRLATVGRLAGGVAHEIRNPLSSIKGFAVYFKERHAEDAPIADIMIQEVERLNRVVSQLLDFSKPVRLTRQSMPFRKVIEASLKLIERQVKDQRIELKTVLPESDEQIRVDPDRLGQVLFNLYLNALEAMENGGILTVAASTEPSTGNAIIRITDTGNGIAPEHLGHVFDPYFTTKPTGTGLGLAIVHNIVEAHGGMLSFDSRPDRGTTVTIMLPTDASKP